MLASGVILKFSAIVAVVFYQRSRLACNYWLPLDLSDKEDLVLVILLVEGELACLAEGFVAALIRALEWLLSCVNISVFFHVLPESELLVADHTDELLCWGMCGDMTSEREARCELIVTVFVLAFKWSLHPYSCRLAIMFFRYLFHYKEVRFYINDLNFI
jgi:hypothetical protein